MAAEWTEQDEATWDYLDSKSYAERSTDEEMAYKGLSAKRNYLHQTMMAKKKAAMEKAGPFHKPAIVCVLLGLGSCVGGGISFSNNDNGSGGWFILLGIGLVILSGILNGLNQKIMGTDED